MKTTVIVSQCLEYSTDALTRAIEEIFSREPLYIDSICRSKKVLLKPNLIIADSPENATVTHPRLIEVLIDLLQSKGAQVSIGDSPAFGSAKGVAKACGLAPIAKRMNVPIVSFKKNQNIERFKNVPSFLDAFPLAKQKRIASLSTVSASINDFDTIINLPKLKAHVQMGFTSATKNLYGLISGKAKVLRHFLVDDDIELFALFILHILERVQPEFTILDAVETLEKHGPRDGEVMRRGVLIGGRSCSAIDRIVTELIGCDLQEHVIASFAKQYNVAYSDLNDIEVYNPEKSDLKGFQLCEKHVPISFSLPRVIVSMIRHILIQFAEKSKKDQSYL